jgi:hypothetical protein
MAKQAAFSFKLSLSNSFEKFAKTASPVLTFPVLAEAGTRLAAASEGTGYQPDLFWLL